MSLVIVGSLALDTIETSEMRKEKIVGGSCTYGSLAASFFTAPKIVGVVGEDFPSDVIRLFRKKRIDIQGLEVTDGKTFAWEGRYGRDPNQRITVRLDMNVFADFRPRLPVSYRNSEILFLANIDPELQEDILRQSQRPEWVAMDTIRHWIEKKQRALLRVLTKCHLFFCNDEEARLLSGELNLVRAGKEILKMGPRMVVIKKGEHGALVFHREFVFGSLAFPCEKVVDPTGAGDAFAGGFLGYLDSVSSPDEKDFRRAAAYGSVMASFAIEDFGIERLTNLKRAEVKERFRKFQRFAAV